MADVKISALPSSGALTGATLFATVTGGITQKSTNGQLAESIAQIYTGLLPPAAPNHPTLPALFYPHGGGPLQQWDVPSQAWV